LIGPKNEITSARHSVPDIGTGVTQVTVVVKKPTVMHQVVMKDFERWLKRTGRSPAERASRSVLRKQLGI
jgi:hypothetical protein